VENLLRLSLILAACLRNSYRTREVETSVPDRPDPQAPAAVPVAALFFSLPQAILLGTEPDLALEAEDEGHAMVTG
jgi:hypothetical protein